MPESIFGRPSQHLLPSHPPSTAGGSSVASDLCTTPVKPTPVSFKDFRFNSIGKQPELLSRISLPQPDHTDSRSSTPSPTSTPSPAFTNNGAPQPKLPSRPTLYQQLAGSHSSRPMDGSLSWHPPTSQSNRSLASRIQMDSSPSNDDANAARSAASRPTSSPSHANSIRRAVQDTSLIPPVEVLPRAPDSPLTTPASSAPTLEPLDAHSLTSSTPLMNTTAIKSSTPSSISASVVSRKPTEPFQAFGVVNAMTQDPQLSPSVAATIDSLVARQERFQAINANLANLASPLHLLSQTSSPDPSSASREDDTITPSQSSQSQHSSIPIVHRHPYLANQPSSSPGLSINDIPMGTNGSSLALVHSSMTVTQEYHAHHKAVAEAIHSLNSAFSAIFHAQNDSENALAVQRRIFEEQRVAFEQMKRVEETTLHKEFQELQKKYEELNAKEALLTSLEQENKAREVDRKAMLARRQAQEEEKRAAETKRMQEVQEQIAAAVTELKEFEALKSTGRLGQLASETLPDDLPTESQEGMGEEEIAVIKSRNDLLRALKHLRRMHSDKVQKLEESNHTLRKLGEERKQREVAEAKLRRISKELHLQAHAEAEWACQSLDKKQRRLEAERIDQEAGNSHEQTRPSVKKGAHTEAQARGLRPAGATTDQTFEHRDHPGKVGLSQQQGIADMARIRPAAEVNPFSSEVTTVMSIDEGGKASAPHHTDPLPNNTSTGSSLSATSQSKRKEGGPVLGGVTLGTSTPKTNSEHLPPELLAKSPSTSDRVAENALNSTRTIPLLSESGKGRHESPLPTQVALDSNSTTNADICPTPHPKPPFSRTSRSQAFLDATIGGSKEFNIGPVIGVSPTQRNVNLRHLKRNRSRVEESDSGDRSVRNSVKTEETFLVTVKREEHDDQPSACTQALPSTNPLVTLPPRPAVIPPPRLRKRHVVPVSSSYPSGSKQSSSTKGEAGVTTDEQHREPFSQGSASSQAMNASMQLPVPVETVNSLPLGVAYLEPQPKVSNVNASGQPIQGRTKNFDATSPESAASTTLSHEMNGEDSSRSNKRFTDEQRRARDVNNSRRPSDHYSPLLATSPSIVASPTQPYRHDSWRQRNVSNGPRAETMGATSPSTGRKRPSESNDNEHGHRARRQRSDLWIPRDRERDRADSYLPHWDRRIDTDPDEPRAAYGASTSLPDRIRSYPSDIARVTYDNRTHMSPFSEAVVTRWEQSYGRSENDDTYYQPSAPGYNVGRRHADDITVGQTYEPMTETEEWMDGQSDPPLLARISDTQHFPPSTNPRGGGRGELNRGRGEFGRGRGRGVARGRRLKGLTPRPASLGDRLT